MDKAKDLYRLQRQAKQIEKELKNIYIEAEADGLKVTVNGEQNFIEATIPDAMASDLKLIAKSFVEASNKAIKKSQMIAADKMKDVMGGMGGLFGAPE